MALFADAGPQGFGVGADRVDQHTPWGSVVFSDKNRRVATTTLSPELQALFDQQMQAQQLLGQRGIDMSAALPGVGKPVIGGGQFALDAFTMPDFGRGAQTGVGNRFNLLNMLKPGMDFSKERSRVEGATFDRMMSLLNPELARGEEALRQRLANQGLPQASRAATAELGRFEDTSNRAREQAALAAVLAGGDEQSRILGDLLTTSAAGMGQAQQQRQNLLGEALAQYGADTSRQLTQRGVRTSEALTNRQIPFNELMAIMGMNQVGMPQFQQQAGANIAGAQLEAQNAAGKNALFGDLIGGALGAGGSVGAGYFMGRR